MSDVFVSYRRDDTAEMACMLGKLIQKEFGVGSVFVDVNEIPYGVDFRDFISNAVAKCKVLLAIIGDNWFVAEAGTSKRRIDDPGDFVRTEIKAALERGIPVIPVLLGNAKTPSAAELPDELEALAYRQAAELRSGRDLNNQLNDLISQLAQHLEEEKEEEEKEEKPTSDSATGELDAETRALLDELMRILPPSNIAEPPGDLGVALREGKQAVRMKLAVLATAAEERPLSLDDIEEAVSLAISHGAGIYNHSARGRLGCGEIYFLAAKGLVDLSVSQSAERASSDTQLALRWLKSIVDAAGGITSENGDDVAWQLRYCFDSIPLIPRCEEVTRALHDVAGRHDTKLLSRMIRQVVESGRNLPPHVSAYYLRHAAGVLLGLYDRQQFQQSAVNRAAAGLARVEALSAPIGHLNGTELRDSLNQALIDFCQNVEAGNGGGNGRSWFGLWKKQ